VFDWKTYDDKFAVEDDDKLTAHEARGRVGTYTVYDPSDEGSFEVFYADASREKRFGMQGCKVKIGATVDLDAAKKLAETHEERLKKTTHSEDR